MKLSTTFRRAHNLIAEGAPDYSCDAILAVKGHHPSALLWWRVYFTPSEDSPEHYWLRGMEMPYAECREWRLTGLLLAAAITKSEGL